MLGGAGDPAHANASRAYRFGKTNLMLHYALDGKADWGDPELENVLLLHLTDGLNAVSEACNAS